MEMNQGDAGARLLVRTFGGEWAPPSVTSYSTEAHLQSVLGSQGSAPSLVGTGVVKF